MADIPCERPDLPEIDDFDFVKNCAVPIAPPPILGSGPAGIGSQLLDPVPPLASTASVGPPGPPGSPGANGTNGADGAPGSSYVPLPPPPRDPEADCLEWYTGYRQLSSVTVHEGENLSPGQLIGWIASIGPDSYSHFSLGDGIKILDIPSNSIVGQSIDISTWIPYTETGIRNPLAAPVDTAPTFDAGQLLLIQGFFQNWLGVDDMDAVSELGSINHGGGEYYAVDIVGVSSSGPGTSPLSDASVYSACSSADVQSVVVSVTQDLDSYFTVVVKHSYGACTPEDTGNPSEDWSPIKKITVGTGKLCIDPPRPSVIEGLSADVSEAIANWMFAQIDAGEWTGALFPTVFSGERKTLFLPKGSSTEDIDCIRAGEGCCEEEEPDCPDCEPCSDEDIIPMEIGVPVSTSREMEEDGGGDVAEDGGGWFEGDPSPYLYTYTYYYDLSTIYYSVCLPRAGCLYKLTISNVEPQYPLIHEDPLVNPSFYVDVFTREACHPDGQINIYNQERSPDAYRPDLTFYIPARETACEKVFIIIRPQYGGESDDSITPGTQYSTLDFDITVEESCENPWFEIISSAPSGNVVIGDLSILDPDYDYYVFDWGDGSPTVEVSPGEEATYTYSASGTYTATLTRYTVADVLIDSVTRDIEVIS